MGLEVQGGEETDEIERIAWKGVTVGGCTGKSGKCQIGRRVERE